MASENAWRFMYSEPFQILVDNLVIQYGTISYFNRYMADRLHDKHINNLLFEMYAIQKSETGYYFKFTLKYIDVNRQEHTIFSNFDNLHISFHQRSNLYNQTHIKVIKNGITSEIPITFSKDGDKIKVHIIQQAIYDFLGNLGIQQILESQFGLTVKEAFDLYQNCVTVFDILNEALPNLFDTIDQSISYVYKSPLLLPQERPGRQASQLAGGHLAKFVKYKFKNLEL